MRRTSVRWLAAVAFLAAPASAQNVTTSQGISISLRGIMSGTLFYQDANFGLGNGQKAQFVASERDDGVLGGDVRNMRLTLGLTGPEVGGGWRAGGTFEIDFFGPFASGGNFGDEQPVPRLRLALVDVTNGRTTFRAGQGWALTLGNIPVSTSHIGFPLGWGPGGFIGWRFPGVWFSQTLSAPDAPTTTRLQLAVLRNSWEDEPAGADDQFNAGERGLPQFEGRIDVSGANWSGYVVAHVDQKDSVNTDGDDLTSWVSQVGLRFQRGNLTVHGNAHVGKGMGHHFAQIVQMGSGIAGWGAWAQVGLNLSPGWSVWGYYGTENPDDEDVGAGRVRSWLFVPMLRYQAGPYAIGLEWLHNDTQSQDGAGALSYVSGNQLLASVRYDF